MREILFVSHATASLDSNFARWLSMQLTGLGYEVWCDLIKLKGGEDFWKDIEQVIRNRTCKFLIVLSKNSNERDGVLKEVAVAEKTKRELQDDTFIIPLNIDDELSHEEVNIELIRLNSVDFKPSWATGLKMLLERLEECNVPRGEGTYDKVNHLWQTVYLNGRKPIEKEETYCSNWFPITSLPKALYFHRYRKLVPKRIDFRRLPFPAARFKDCVTTFAWCYDFIGNFPRTEVYDPKDTLEILTEDIFKEEFEHEFVTRHEARNLIVQLLNKGFENAMSGKQVSLYEMSKGLAYWFKKGVLEKDKFNKVKLVGKAKEKTWHFGISGTFKLFPEKCLAVSTRIFFTTDGSELIRSKARQHSSRRKQGRNWWNRHWRDKLLAMMQALEDEEGILKLQLGSEEFALISTAPVEFVSPVSYLITSVENLSYEADFDGDPEDEMEVAETD